MKPGRCALVSGRCMSMHEVGGGGFMCQAPVEGYREFQTPVKKIWNQNHFAAVFKELFAGAVCSFISSHSAVNHFHISGRNILY